MDLKMKIINSKLLTTNYKSYQESFTHLTIDELLYLRDRVTQKRIIELIDDLIIEKRDNLLGIILKDS